MNKKFKLDVDVQICTFFFPYLGQKYHNRSRETLLISYTFHWSMWSGFIIQLVGCSPGRISSKTTSFQKAFQTEYFRWQNTAENKCNRCKIVEPHTWRVVHRSLFKVRYLRFQFSWKLPIQEFGAGSEFSWSSSSVSVEVYLSGIMWFGTE